MASKELDFEFLDTSESGDQQLGTLGNYRVLKEIGRGGMGFVLLAQDKRLERMVALKVMNKKVAGSPGSRKRFLSEARAMAAVHHDNVATIFEVGEVKRTPFMAMELLEGGTLEKYNQRFGQPDFKKIIQFARDIARGLSAAHARGIVHRDIKPANIWYNDKLDRIKILDFGLALAQSPEDQLSSLGAVVGTPGYLSPEQARSEPLDDRSDLYAVGVLLYELATGQLPLKATTVAGQLIAILTHDPVPVRQHNSNIPEPLAALIERLMSKEARDRVQSADQLQDLLDQVEKDCESKTEVAQAINQLAQGLQQAVTKKQEPTPSAKPVAGLTPAPIAAGPDLSQTLQALPNPALASQTQANAAFPNPAPANTTAYNPAMRPQPARKRAQNPSNSGPNPGLIGGLIGLAIAVIAAIGIGIYLYSGTEQVAETTPNNSSQTNPQSNNSPPPNKPNQTKPNRNANKPNQNREPKSQQPKRQQPTRATFTHVAASSTNSNKLDSPSHAGQTILINDRKGNGSFEDGTQETTAANIPGWTLKKSGKSGGWFKFNRQQDQKTLTQAFAGPASQIVLHSSPLAYQCKAGDVLRVSFSIGGNGQGTSEYRVLIALTGSDGKPDRYQVADIKTPATGSKASRPGYDLAINQKMANKKPQLIIEVTNPTQTRKRATLDRVILSVDKATAKTAGPPQPKPATNPKTAPPKNPKTTGGQKLVF
ncbi:MAG: hypothetical protein CBB71_06585 [Rhodopirellula sp. TMED11]|nr:MAG: hypothetical protein CBB71_06585 [Rhodopirellula sp. TMED11]